MRSGKAFGLALAGCGLLAAAPGIALADEEASLQDRIQDLEQQVRELREALGRKQEAPTEGLSVQVEKYLQEMEKGSLWQDRNGKPLGKVLDSVYMTAWLRTRPTWSSNYFDLDESTDDEGFQNFFRGKLGFGANLKNNVGAYVELDWSSTWGNTATVFTNDNAVAPQVQQAYVDGIYARDLGVDKTRIGRFEMQYGDEYVIGRTDFAPATTHYDGVLFTKNYEKTGFSMDGFATKLIDGYKSGVTATPDDTIYMVGFYGNYYGWEGRTGVPGGFEPYYIWVWNNQQMPGTGSGRPHDIHTLGFRWYGDKATKDKAGLGWNFNANGQYFRTMGWSTDDRVKWTMPDKKWKPQVWGQFAYASGNKDRGFGYIPLFQDVHARYGWADYFAFTNLIVGGVGANVTPTEGLTYGVEFRSIYQARPTVTEGSRLAAYETDFTVSHKYSENVDVEFAYSYISWRNIGSADNVQRAYLQLSVSF